MNPTLNCRNFKCVNNESGECMQEVIQLVPQGTLISTVTCIQAGERASEEVDLAAAGEALDAGEQAVDYDGDPENRRVRGLYGLSD